MALAIRTDSPVRRSHPKRAFSPPPMRTRRCANHGLTAQRARPTKSPTHCAPTFVRAGSTATPSKLCSVRPVTAFTLRLAQAMHGRAHRCRVVAFVDRPVEVTQQLLAGGGDGALARVLAHPAVDLEASSDYGRVFDELLTDHAGLLDARTSVLVVGDGRCNGLPARADRLADLRRRVHRLAWITPEPERYRQQATCAMPDYAEACDRVVVARDGAQLLDRAAELGHALR